MKPNKAKEKKDNWVVISKEDLRYATDSTIIIIQASSAEEAVDLYQEGWPSDGSTEFRVGTLQDLWDGYELESITAKKKVGELVEQI